MATLHRSFAGVSLIGHGGADCACKPERITTQKQVSSGRKSHQGYKTEVTYMHKAMPQKAEAKS